MPTYIDELETPVPLVDLDRLAHNLDRMAAYAAVHSLRLRPHVKTHKSPRIAAEQLRLGASGLTCATPREAEIMSDLTDDILVAYPPVGAARLQRLVSLPSSVRLTVNVDAPESVRALATAASIARREIGVYVEVDLGMHRVGVAGPNEAVALARLVSEQSSLRYDGIAFYPGHIREAITQQDASLTQLRTDLARVSDALAGAGLTPGVVSGGSTPAAWRMHEVDGVTEVRPGTYAYNDRTTAAVGACEWDDCALTVLATVVSTSVPGQAVIDAGTKALGREPMRGVDGEGFGAMLDRPEVVVSRMSEEHGILDLSRTDWRPRVGDLVRIVPNHVCIVVHQFDEIVGVRNGVAESKWPVTARGRLRDGTA
jgi:D-serine deaminase-like pyridoxal phosphate-dependent protein